MDKYIIKGTKKLLSLTRTKIRLACESQTKYTRPKPLPLVKLLSGRELETIEQAKEHRDELTKVDFSDPKNTAETIFQLMDIIEGVKYKFEPKEFCACIDEKKLKELETQAMKDSLPVNLLLMTKKSPPGVNLFVGWDPPENSIFLSRVPTTLSFFLNFAFNSDYFSEGLKLTNVNAVLGHRTLILNAIHFALGEFGAKLDYEDGT